MSGTTWPISAVAILAALAGAALAIYGTLRAVRPQTPARGFTGIALAGVGYALLALGAAVRSPHDHGLRAVALQGGTVLLAALLGGLSLERSGDDRSGSGRGLALVALFVAWLSLLGLPPTAGFHARILVYRSLLHAGWAGTLALTLAVSAAGLVPAFSALALGSPGRLRGGRAFLAALLLLALLAAGLYPGLGIAAADFLVGSR